MGVMEPPSVHRISVLCHLLLFVVSCQGYRGTLSRVRKCVSLFLTVILCENFTLSTAISGID